MPVNNIPFHWIHVYIFLISCELKTKRIGLSTCMYEEHHWNCYNKLATVLKKGKNFQLHFRPNALAYITVVILDKKYNKELNK